MVQIKKLKKIVDEKLTKMKAEMERLEVNRHQALIQIGNVVHPTVPVSDDEDNNRVERTFGDTNIRKKYSHVG